MHARPLRIPLASAGLALLVAISLASKPQARAELDSDRLALIDPAINAAIAEHKLPGAVVLVGRGDETAYKKAFGARALVPSREAMTADTVFDLASLTKVVATTPAVMLLVEQGRIG